MSSAIVVVEIDCAAQAKNMGVAVGESAGDRCRVREVFKCSQMSALIDRVASVLGRSSRALLSLDAPLGWPVALISALQGHGAGRPLGPNADLLFCRDTDREIRTRHALKPLDVGADRIARVARSALELLEDLRNASGEEIPLLWQPGLDGRTGAIEVYPKATLKAHGLPFSGYKGTGSGHREAREDLVAALRRCISLDPDTGAMIADDDLLDAAVCVLAGHDFLTRNARAPSNVESCRTEGWIWVRDPS